MAADSACTDHGTLHCEIKKLTHAKDGSVIAVTGTAFDLAEFARWYDDGQKRGELRVHDDFEALVLKPDGKIWCFNHKGQSFIHPAPAASGSGAKFAYGAMEAGSSPEEAVEIACRRNIHSQGPVWVLKPIKRKKKRA